MLKLLKCSLVGFLPFSLVYSQNFTQKQIQSLQGKTQLSYEDLSHENPGCPENSFCSKEMGEKMKQWDKFIKSLSKSKDPSKSIENYRKKNGIPVTFLTKKESSISLDPILFNSRCEKHKSKDAGQTIYKATQFFRNNPNTKFATFDKAILVSEKSKTEFLIPYEEFPIMVKKNSLLIPREHENVYYHLAIEKTGDWKVVSPGQKELSKALRVMENITCPKELKLQANNFCKSIWNADKKKVETIILSWSCP